MERRGYEESARAPPGKPEEQDRRSGKEKHADPRPPGAVAAGQESQGERPDGATVMVRPASPAPSANVLKC